jgi:[NiFe] hydrogenase assembly HybE family chaperone
MPDQPHHSAVTRLIEAYRHINEQSMQGLPIVNPQLEVDAVGFTVWRGRLLGIIITPWFMNLTLLPIEQEEDWSNLKPGNKRTWELPSGNYEFIVSPIEGVGVHQSLSLFTTVTDFPDHQVARAVAQAIMDKLLEHCTVRPEKTTVSRRELLRKFIPKECG